MTTEQIMAVRRTLPPYMEPKKWTAKQKKLDRELWCREMMISMFAYSGTISITNEESWSFQQYLQQYVGELGRKRFDEIRKEQLDTFSSATVSRGVYEDCDGCTYNSINWG